MNYEQQIGEFYVLKTLQTFYPKDLVWYGNYQLEKKWEKGTIVKQVGSVTYLTANSQNIFQKDIDQLCAAYTNNDVDIMNILVKTILQKIQIIKYYPNHKIPIEPQLLNQILNQILLVKMGNYFNILLKH